MVAMNSRATILVSMSDDGVPFTDGSPNARMSDDGRFVTFMGTPGGFNQVYLRDTLTSRTYLVSASNGVPGNGSSVGPDVSDDGRFVIFNSAATNLVPDEIDTTSTNVFMRDMSTGMVVHMSTTVDGLPAAGVSSIPRITGDGRTIVFKSSAANLVPGDANGLEDLFLKDTLTGEVQLISRSTSGAANNGTIVPPLSISDDGRFVGFLGDASSLVSGDTNGAYDAFIRDTLLGTTTRVSVPSSGAQANGGTTGMAMSSDGRYVAFHSIASNVVGGDTNGVEDVFLRNIVAGTTARVSVGIGGAQANGGSFVRDVSADGRYVVFWSTASNLVSGDTNAEPDIFLRDMVEGVTLRLSVGLGGVQSRGRGTADISDDGRYVTFTSDGTGIVPGDHTPNYDVFRVSLFASETMDWMVGSDASDTILALGGSDVLDGGLGNDILNGGAGVDKMSGGAGNDLFFVDNPGDRAVELAVEGFDTVATSVSYKLGTTDVIEVLKTTSAGGTAALELTGNTFGQEITGNAGANVLHDGGLGASDTLRGLGGNDSYRVYNGGDIIVESASQGTADRVLAAVDYKLGAGVFIEQLTTNGSSGTSGIDLAGNEIAQEIVGNAGDNRIEGRGGNDTLKGLLGKDTFVINTSLGTGNVDTITDFKVVDDRFLLSDAVFKALSPGTLASAAFRANTTGLAGDASDRIIYETDTGRVFYDADGTGATAGIHFATVTAGLSLTNADFSVA